LEADVANRGAMDGATPQVPTADDGVGAAAGAALSLSLPRLEPTQNLQGTQK